MPRISPVDTSLLSPHLKFWGNGPSSTVWEDKSGNGNHFTTVHGTATANNAYYPSGYFSNGTGANMIHKISGDDADILNPLLSTTPYDPLQFTAIGRSCLFAFDFNFTNFTNGFVDFVICHCPVVANNLLNKGFVLRFRKVGGTHVILDWYGHTATVLSSSNITALGTHRFVVAIHITGGVAKLTFYIDGVVDGTVDDTTITGSLASNPRTDYVFNIGGYGVLASDPSNNAEMTGSGYAAGEFLNDLQLYHTDDAAGLPSNVFTANTGLVAKLSNHRGRPLTAEQWA